MKALSDALLAQLQIKRSARRKTIGIRFYPDRIQINTPSTVNQAQLLDILAQKQQWLSHRLAQARERFGDLPVHTYHTGTQMPYLGNDYVLCVNEGAHTGIQLSGDQLQVTLSRRGRRPQAARVRDALSGWYQERALLMLTQKSESLAASLGKTVAGIKVKHTRSKWGHCTSTGHLQFNWLIVQAPEAIVDYLVAHEVSHLVHANHSAAFWHQVAQLYPDFLTARRWLKQQGHRLRM